MNKTFINIGSGDGTIKIVAILKVVLGPFEKNNFPSPNQAY